MVLAIVLAALFLLFYATRRHIGPAHLAMIAGISVFSTFGVDFTNFIHENLFPGVGTDLIGTIVYLLLVAVFPILLYLRSAAGGFFGLLRIAESAIFAAIMTSLISTQLAYFFPFDSLAVEISGYIDSIKSIIVLIGVIAAYIDLLFYRDK